VKRMARRGFLGLLLVLSCGSGTLLAGDISDIVLVDQEGRDVSLSSMFGQVVLLVFGFTHCPHICPVEMARAGAALEALGDAAGQVRAVFITVDPQRDTPDVIKAYLGNFHPGFIGLTGEPADLAAIAEHYRVKRVVLEQQNANVLFDHGYSLYLLNRQGEAEAVVLPGLPPEHIVALLQELIAE